MQAYAAHYTWSEAAPRGCTFLPIPNHTQAERFMMPYSFAPLSAQRPSITGKSAEAVPMGGSLTLAYTGTVTHAVIAAPGAVTHQVGITAC